MLGSGAARRDHDAVKQLIVLVLVALAGAGGCRDEATISTDQAVTALRRAGFHNLTVLSNEAAMKRAARQLRDPDLARDAVDVDVILPRGRFKSFFTLRIFAVRYPSVGNAKKVQENDRPFLEGQIPRAVRRLLPANFDAARIHEVRVCNVLVSSYIAHGDGKLTNRFELATELLRDACG
jgi:hypothetical protein